MALYEESAVRCSECGRETDEFTTIFVRWLCYSDGRDLYAYCPECAKRKLSDDAAPSASTRESRGGQTPGRRRASQRAHT